ncbi:MAG: hypothetical protein PVJ33_17200, partial [Lysobacterales bacterium]
MLASAQVALDVIAEKGESAPGTASTFNGFGVPATNGSSEVTFQADLSDGETGIWGPDGLGGLERVAETGQAAPGAPAGDTFLSFSDPLLNAAGQVAFEAELDVAVARSYRWGIWKTDGAGSLGLVARGGANAPGLLFGEEFTNLLGQPVFNDLGDVAFHAQTN